MSLIDSFMGVFLISFTSGYVCVNPVIFIFLQKESLKYVIIHIICIPYCRFPNVEKKAKRKIY